VLGETAAAAQAKVQTIPPAVLDIVRESLVVGTPGDAVAYYRPLVAAGMRYFIPTLLDNDFETLRLLAREVIPALNAT
jgi:hypothetical protein